MVFTDGEVVRVGTELNAVNGSFLVKFIQYFVHSLINEVDSALFSSRYNVVSFAGQAIYIVGMNVFYLMLKGTNSQIPYSYLPVLTPAHANLVVLK